MRPSTWGAPPSLQRDLGPTSLQEVCGPKATLEEAFSNEFLLSHGPNGFAPFSQSRKLTSQDRTEHSNRVKRMHRCTGTHTHGSAVLLHAVGGQGSSVQILRWERRRVITHQLPAEVTV